MLNKNITLLLLYSLLSSHNIYATDVCKTYPSFPVKTYPSCVFLPVKQDDSTEYKKQWQENSLPINIPPSDNDVSLEVGWKLKDKIENSNEWRIAVNVKY